ncbi:MAG TPA: hypothetical protein VKP30_24690 [Polyangiaceae bacterium]|nr:hypothetical protein [Polyangiaceae bacterium]
MNHGGRSGRASSKRQARGSSYVTLAGAWAHVPAAPPADPVGVAQGVDLIVIKGDDKLF